MSSMRKKATVGKTAGSEADKENICPYTKSATVGLGKSIDPFRNKLTGKDHEEAVKVFKDPNCDESKTAYPRWLGPLWALLTVVSGVSFVRGYMADDDARKGTQAVLLTLFVLLFYGDLISGLVHIVLDDPRNLHVPVLDDLARGFQQHHQEPTLICRLPLDDFLIPMSYAVVVIWVLGLLCSLLFAPTGTAGAITVFLSQWQFHLYSILGSVALVQMQMGHRWAHLPLEERRGMPVVLGLQKLRLAVPPHVHYQHHKAPYVNNYCIATGIANGFLNWVTTSTLQCFRVGPDFEGNAVVWRLVLLLAFLGPAVWFCAVRPCLHA